MELSSEETKNMFQREEDRLKELFHINKYEHVNELRYIVTVFIYSLVGILVGSIVNASIKKIQGSNTRKRSSCIFFGTLNILVIIVMFWLLNVRAFIRKGLYFDDWIWNTMAGFLCITLFFESQTQLAANMACATRF